jgi:hypothetical protein
VTLIKAQRGSQKGGRTHVLIIGINDYPNANPNSNDRQAQAAREYSTLLGVSQLSSPAVSARAFADWFLAEFHNPAAGLGSLELLLSESLMTYQNEQVEKANFKNIIDAFQRWASRCDEHKDNVGVFYFSGHGAEGCNQILLPSDFPIISPNNHRPDWTQVIDINATRAVMRYCRAQGQFYFLDCCRTRLRGPLASQPLGATLYSPDLDPRQLGSAAQAVYAVEDQTTGAAPHQISGFTALLLHSLRGAAAQPEGGKWHVASETLHRACKRIKEVFEEDFIGGHEALSSVFPNVSADIKLSSSVERLLLHHYRKKTPPAVPVRVTHDLGDSAFGASYCAVSRTETIHLSWNTRRRHAHTRLKPGKHEFQIHLDGGESHKFRKSVQPPVCELHHHRPSSERESR